MTILTEYYIGCDAPDGDGYCTARTDTYSSHNDAINAAEAAGLVPVFDGDDDHACLDICPHHAGTDA